MAYFEEEKNEKTYDLIPEGEHICKLDDFMLGDHTFKKDNVTCPMIKLTWKTAEGRLLWTNLYFAERMDWKINQFMGAMNILNEVKANCQDPKNHQSVANAVHLALKSRMGKAFTVKVEHSEYNGKTYANADVVEPLTKTLENHAPQTAKEKPPEFDKSEQVPF